MNALPGQTNRSAAYWRKFETLDEWRDRCDNRAAKIQAAPHFVYRAFDTYGLLLYIGCTLDVDNRLAAHRSTSAWHKYAETFTTEGPFDGRDPARAAETHAINTEASYFNATQADIQRTQANRHAADRVLAARGVSEPPWDESLLDDETYCDAIEAQSRAHEHLRLDVRAELNASGEFPYLTDQGRVERYLAARENLSRSLNLGGAA